MAISREKLILAGLVLPISFFLESCFEEKEPKKIPDGLKNLIERDMAEVGLGQGWYPLVSFEDLTYEQRMELGNLPRSGLFTLNSNEDQFSFVFSVQEQKRRKVMLLKITESTSRIKGVKLASVPAQVKIGLDLSKFVNKSGQVVKYLTAEDYLKPRGSIISITLKGNEEDLKPFAKNIR